MGIIKWLVVFIIGSLIVTFIVSPGSFTNAKDNIKSVFSNIKINQNNINTTIKEYPGYACSYFELAAEAGGVSKSTLFKSTCSSWCSGNIGGASLGNSPSLGYHDYYCENDKLKCVCYAATSAEDVKDCSLNGVTYRSAPSGGMISYGWHVFEYNVASTDGRIKNAMMILENSSGGTIISSTKTVGDAYCSSKSCYLNLTYEVGNGNLWGSSYYVDLGCGYIKLQM